MSQQEPPGEVETKGRLSSFVMKLISWPLSVQLEPASWVENLINLAVVIIFVMWSTALPIDKVLGYVKTYYAVGVLLIGFGRLNGGIMVYVKRLMASALLGMILVCLCAWVGSVV